MSSPNITLACGALLLCLTGCHSPRVAKSGDPAPRQSVHIPIDTITSLAVSQLVDTFQVVPIRVPPDERIGKIARICPGPAHSLFILDKVGPTIHVIDGSGQYLYSINHSGSGPGNYRNISDMQIDPDGHSIGIIDPLQAKFMRFDLHGKLITEYSLVGTAGIANFSFLSDGEIAFSRSIPPDRDDLQYSITIMSPDMHRKRRLLHYDQSSSSVLSADYPFQYVGGHAYYLPVYRPEIDRIDSGDIFPEYGLDFGGKWITPDYAYRSSHTEDNHWIRAELPHSGFVYFVNYALLTSHLLLYYSYEGRDYLSLVDRRTGNERHTRLGNDFSLLGFSADNTAVINDSLYVACVPDCSRLSQLTDGKYGPALRALAASSGAQNPVLLFTTFKRIP